LLTETGSVFVQIGDENVHLVRCLMDEVMGSENFVSLIPFAKTSGFAPVYLSNVCDLLLWYGKNKNQVKYRQLFKDKVEGRGFDVYQWIALEDGTRRKLTAEEKENRELIPRNAKLFRLSDICSQGMTNTNQDFEFEGKIYKPRLGTHWATTVEGLKRLAMQKRIMLSAGYPNFARFLDDYPVTPISNFWDDTATGSFTDDKIYVVQTGSKVIQRCLLMTTDPGDLVLDPTCGSGTTAYVAEQWGRRWITIDTSRVALALARTRIMSAKYPYYLLSDSQEGIEKETEVSFSRHSRENGNPETKKLDARLRTSGMTSKIENDIKKGFVYKRVPHITLKSIANNPDIKEGMSREDIDAAISKHADTEILYDQPYTDNKRIRVSGPFTVESLSPHRILSSDEERPKSEKSPERTSGHGQFETMILENLKKAGAQNTIKNERLKFDRLETFAGLYIHGDGEYTESGEARRVAVCIGPEHGTVSPELVKEAAKEAMKGAGFDLLIVCGFAFDPHANEVAKQFAPEISPNPSLPKRGTVAPTLEKGGKGGFDDPVIAESMRKYGKLTVLLARMNPDLAMGDELLKKTGAGNLFMIFGEPDIRIEKLKDKMMTVEIKGLDVYDPTTGQIRSHSTDDIACWFIDTDYNEESFFVRHAYFSGADEPYERLKKALKAEIDESAWSTIYSTKSRPFPMPSKNKIAVKVINHYGDEVLKVYDVGKT
ncbi:MAG: site-specific DNA-methyltransferase, partial [Nitrospirae bacterium CG_4_8_14_3_um_filter_44_28]